MKHITILSDINYSVLGVACIRSLARTTSVPLTIHYYCVDMDTYNAFNKLNLRTEKVQVIAYAPDVIFQVKTDKSIAMSNLKNTNYIYFLWTLASYFSDYIMKKIDQPVTYIDSDIYFHNDIKLIYHEIGSKDCGIFKHRFLDDGRPDISASGKYNVGVVYFNNSVKGKYLLDWWSDAVVHKKYPQYATCGDQKYLEYFTTCCDSTELYIDDNIGHGAPWDWQVYDLSRIKDGVLIWKNQNLPHVFSHFSKFGFDFDKNDFKCITPPTLYAGLNNNHIAYKNRDLIEIHRNYYEELKVSYNILRQHTSISASNMFTQPTIRPIRWGLSKLRLG